VEALIRYIDNASTDQSVSLVRRQLPGAEIIQLSENRGFAGAHNAGLARCTTAYVLTHDPDLAVDWPGVQKLLAAFADPHLAAIQGKLLRAQGNIIDSAGIIRTRALNGHERGALEEDQGQYEEAAPLLAVTGACGMYRMAALQDVEEPGGQYFDEDFFAYKEDVDLGWRLNRAGWKVCYRPVYVGRHRRSLGRRGLMNWGIRPDAVMVRLRTKRTRYSLRNWVWMMAKNASLKEEMAAELFIDARLLLFFCFSLLYWPLFPVWGEIIRGLPDMMNKREVT
jgi:GT2 family glycosyltransferase